MFFFYVSELQCWSEFNLIPPITVTDIKLDDFELIRVFLIGIWLWFHGYLMILILFIEKGDNHSILSHLLTLNLMIFSEFELCWLKFDCGSIGIWWYWFFSLKKKHLITFNDIKLDDFQWIRVVLIEIWLWFHRYLMILILFIEKEAFYHIYWH